MSASLQRISHFEPLPDESQCPVCGYFDVSHPDVQRMLLAQDPSKQLFYQAQCRCSGLADKAKRDDALRHSQSGLPHDDEPRMFLGFEARTGTEAALETALQFASLPRAPSVLLLLGETGTGKSHLLEAIGRHVLANSNWKVRYDTSTRFLDRLRWSYSDATNETIETLLAWYQQRKLVLLDDLGAEKATDWAVERLVSFIDDRMVMRLHLAIATNLDAEEMARRLGERLASRLFQTNAALGEVARVSLTATDYRRPA